MRRDTRRVRLATAVCLATVVGGIVILRHYKEQRRAKGASVAALTALPPPAFAPEAEPPRSPPSSSVAVAAAPPVAAPVVAASDAPRAEPAAAAVRDDATAACGHAYDRHRWRTAVKACAAAFETQPHDAALAMKVAQAQHARGHYGDAGEWARRAIGLDGVDPEAFVILAHAEARAGHPLAARAAYRRYLTLAPRGWHASEARAATRAAARSNARRASAPESTSATAPPDAAAAAPVPVI
jgi:hypothetical protein